jgi:N-methylhydantoinase A
MPFSVHRRDRIAVGMVLPGPAIIEEDESTTVVPSGASLHIDEHGSLIVKLARAPEHSQEAGA